MAAGALRAALGTEAARVEVGSAGTAAWEGQPATADSVAVARADGVDISAHRSRRLTPELLRGADLVIAMERSHVPAIQSLGADLRHTHVLSEWPEPGDRDLTISDPFGASREAYEECWRRIQAHMSRLTPYVLEAIRARSH